MFQSPTLFVLKDQFWDQNASVKVIETAREITAFKSSCIHRKTPAWEANHSRGHA